MSTITINGQVIDLNELPVDVLLDLQKRTQEAKADLMDKLREEMAEFLTDTVEQVVEGNLITESSTSAWVGASVSSIKVVLPNEDGTEREFSVSVRVTDVKATADRDPLFPKKRTRK